jgi:hypothetical protein
MEGQVDKQVAAPAETRTPNLHRATKIAHRECGWKGGDSVDSAEKRLVQRKNGSAQESEKLVDLLDL